VSASGNANARRQPGERVNELTDEWTLRVSTRDVNTNDLRHPKIDEAKRRLPMPELLKHLELDAHVNTRANTQCPLCHRENTFALRENSDGTWFFECSVCGSGDEITFIQKLLKITRFNAAVRYVQMADVIDAPQKPKTHRFATLNQATVHRASSRVKRSGQQRMLRYKVTP
jgi:hypothetical protein